MLMNTLREEIVACGLLLGNGDSAGRVRKPDGDFDGAAMQTGAAYWSLLVQRSLQ